MHDVQKDWSSEDTAEEEGQHAKSGLIWPEGQVVGSLLGQGPSFRRMLRYSYGYGDTTDPPRLGLPQGVSWGEGQGCKTRRDSTELGVLEPKELVRRRIGANPEAPL